MFHSDGGGLVLKRYGHLYKGARRQATVASRRTSSVGRTSGLWDRRGMTANWGSILARAENTKGPRVRALSRKRTTGFEPATFGLGSRRGES